MNQIKHRLPHLLWREPAIRKIFHYVRLVLKGGRVRTRVYIVFPTAKRPLILGKNRLKRNISIILLIERKLRVIELSQKKIKPYSILSPPIIVATKSGNSGRFFFLGCLGIQPIRGIRLSRWGLDAWLPFPGDSRELPSPSFLREHEELISCGGQQVRLRGQRFSRDCGLVDQVRVGGTEVAALLRRAVRPIVSRREPGFTFASRSLRRGMVTAFASVGL